MLILSKRLAALAIALALMACMGITAFAAESSDPKEESVEVSSKAEVSAVKDKDASALEKEEDTDNPKTGIPAVLPVILLGLTAGSTALLTSKER